MSHAFARNRLAGFVPIIVSFSQATAIGSTVKPLLGIGLPDAN
jgi:hypothetical protein